MLPSLLPDLPGVGFKPALFAAIRAGVSEIGFFEVDAENYMGAGGLPHAQLTTIRADHALSIHGVGLSFAAAQAQAAEAGHDPQPLLVLLMRAGAIVAAKAREMP